MPQEAGAVPFAPTAGTKVEYWSNSKKEYILAKVIEVNEDGSYKLNCKSHAKLEHMRPCQAAPVVNGNSKPQVQEQQASPKKVDFRQVLADAAREAAHVNGVTLRPAPDDELIARAKDKEADDHLRDRHAALVNGSNGCRLASRSREPLRRASRSPERRRASPERRRASPSRSPEPLRRPSVSPAVRRDIHEETRRSLSRPPLRRDSRSPEPRQENRVDPRQEARDLLQEARRQVPELRRGSRSRDRDAPADRIVERSPLKRQSQSPPRRRSRSPSADDELRKKREEFLKQKEREDERVMALQEKDRGDKPRKRSESKHRARDKDKDKEKERRRSPSRKRRSRSRSHKPRSRERERDREKERERERERDRDRERERERERERQRDRDRDRRDRDRDRDPKKDPKRDQRKRSRSRRDDRRDDRRRSRSRRDHRREPSRRRRSRSQRQQRKRTPPRDGGGGFGYRDARARGDRPNNRPDRDRAPQHDNRPLPPPPPPPLEGQMPPLAGEPGAPVDTREMCGDFKRGNCTRGDKCRYSHGDAAYQAQLAARRVNEVRHDRQGVKANQCNSFRDTGSCRFGDNCRFAHGDQQPKPIEDAPQEGQEGEKGKGKGKGEGKGKRKPGDDPKDWTCINTQCNEINFSQRNECYKCRTDKPGFEKPTVKPGEIQASAPGIPPAPDRFSETLWEQPRSEMGLKLIGEDSIEGASWKYVLTDDSRRSYGAFHPSPFSPEQTAAFFEAVKTGTNWMQPVGPYGPIPRKTAWLVAEGCSCTYRYGSIEVEPQVFPPWMIDLMSIVMPIFGSPVRETWPNSCNTNLYDDGDASVGWHSDDERVFQGKFQDIRILSLTLGCPRKFELRVNYPESGERVTRMIKLGDGDLMTMEGMLQKHYMHRVPKEGNITEPRINLTWRWVTKHNPRCGAARMRK